MTQQLLVLMAKQPIPGKTKTRLMPHLTAQQAADLYRCFMVDKLAQMRQVADTDLAIAYTPKTAYGEFHQFVPDFKLILQRGANLAERLYHVMVDGFAEGYERVAAIDGDTVMLPSEYLAQSLEKLREEAVDATIGPTEDGGYYAIGMKAPHRCLFEVTMSTSHVTQDTLAKAHEANLNMITLPEWWDVDHFEDVQRLKLALASHSVPTETAQFLQTLRL